MSFLKNAEKGKNLFSLYILTVILIIIGYAIIGQLPMLIDLALNKYDLTQPGSGEVKQLSAFFGENKMLFYLVLPFVFSLLALVLSVRFIHKRSILSVFTARDSFSWKRFFTAFALWGSVLGIFLLISVKSNQNIEWNLNWSTFFPLLLISLFLIPIQTTCEEVFFRGYLFQALGFSFKKGWIPVIVTGIAFGLMHGANPEVEKLGYSVMLYYIGTGIFLGVIALLDDGLELSMGYHAINNIFAALMLTNDWQAFQTDAVFIDHSAPAFGWDAILTIVLLQPMLLFAFSKLYRWKDWRGKLFN